MTEKFGIEKIKEAVKVGINLGERIAEAYTDDKKITGGEALGIAMKSVGGVIIIIKNATAIKNEYLDLSASEMEELKKYTALLIKCEDKKTEDIIERSIDVLISIDALGKLFY